MADRPNILIILSDQLRRGALGCYGDPNSVTPYIDALASSGVRFTNACSSYPICVPFRFTFMTGVAAHSRLIPGIEWRMSPTERTLADEFNEAGYETIYVGKWHLDGGHGRMGSAKQTNRTPVRREYQGRWEKWYGFELSNEFFDTCYFEDDDPTPIPIDGYQTDGLFDVALEYLENGRDRSRPFCLVLSVEPPHGPFVAPAEYEKRWRAKDIELPPNFTPQAEQRDRILDERAVYYGMVENLDANVGRLQEFLSLAGLADSTVQLFFSDHGEMNGAHGLRGKQYPYEESAGIPLIVSDPRLPERAGVVIEDPTNTEDLFPTILGAAGLESAAVLPGADLSPLIRGEQARLDRFGVPLEFVAELRAGYPFYDETWRAFRSRRFMYTVLGDKNGARPWQFFDLEADPWQLNNLVDDPASREELTRHHRALRDEIAAGDDLFALEPAFGMPGINLWRDRG